LIFHHSRIAERGNDARAPGHYLGEEPVDGVLDAPRVVRDPEPRARALRGRRVEARVRAELLGELGGKRAVRAARRDALVVEQPEQPARI